MTRQRYYTADVFTETRFGGNQLAVFPDARGIADELLLPIAREFNYSETTFVYPPEDPRHTRRVRIFTPGGEVPFAGHPTVGTAHVLAETGAIPLGVAETRIVLEEAVGPVPVTIRAERGTPTFAQLTVARLPEATPAPVSRSELAAILGLDAGDKADEVFAPEIVSCGLPFLYAPVRSRDAVRRARIRIDPWERSLAGTPAEMVMVFAMDAERPDAQVRARMFAPGISVPEDPATGSACVALGGYLAMRSPERDGTLRWLVEQGFEMGRPSLLHVEADKRDGRVVGARVGGKTIMVSEGEMTI